MSKTREAFGNRISFVLASIGGALGLGSVWRFPYITGQYGGAAFIIVFLIALFLIATPILMTEFALGRKTKTGYVGALKSLFPGKRFYFLGVIGVFSLFITLSFYAGVAGWTVAYFFKSIAGTYVGESASTIGAQFGAFSASPLNNTFWLAVMLVLTALIVMRGIENGIEKLNNIFLPIFFILIIVLGAQTIMLPGAEAGLEFYLKPDFSKLTSEAVMAAIGQAFFTLGVGCGNLVIYGSYLDKQKTIGASTILVSSGSTIAAIMFGFIIFPAVFSYGIEPTAGPALVFITLPTVFAQMNFGGLFGTTFFFCLFVACITSTVCILEAIVGYFVDEHNMGRKKATILVSLGIFALGSIQMLSFGPMADVLFFGKTFFEFSSDIIVSVILLPGGALAMVLLVGWKLKPKAILDEINTGEGLKLNRYYKITIKYIAPIAIVIMFLQLVGIIKF